MGLQPAASVGNLVVVLEKGHKHSGREVQRRGATPLVLPRIILPLAEEAVLEGRDHFLRRAVIISVIGLVASGHGDHGAVVKVVVPEGIENIPTLCWLATHSVQL